MCPKSSGMFHATLPCSTHTAVSFPAPKSKIPAERTSLELSSTWLKLSHLQLMPALCEAVTPVLHSDASWSFLPMIHSVKQSFLLSLHHCAGGAFSALQREPREQTIPGWDELIWGEVPLREDFKEFVKSQWHGWLERTTGSSYPVSKPRPVSPWTSRCPRTLRTWWHRLRPGTARAPPCCELL